MDERDLRGLIGQVKSGALSRRGFVQRMLAVGLSAPLAGLMLAENGVAMAADLRAAYKPAKAGGGGALRLLWWQAPTLINPHFAIGTKDQDASRLFYQPLASWNEKGELVATLAAELRVGWLARVGAGEVLADVEDGAAAGPQGGRDE